jgi:hypothetical protein
MAPSAAVGVFPQPRHSTLITSFHFRPESALAVTALLVIEKALLDWRPSFCLSSCGSRM